MLPHILLFAVVAWTSAAGPFKIEIPSRSSTSLFEGQQGKQKVRVALVDSKTGKPLEIDSTGKTIRAKVVAEQTYTRIASAQRRTSLEGHR